MSVRGRLDRDLQRRNQRHAAAEQRAERATELGDREEMEDRPRDRNAQAQPIVGPASALGAAPTRHREVGHREAGEEPDASELAGGLMRYSERGQAYIDELRAMIRHNDDVIEEARTTLAESS